MKTPTPLTPPPWSSCRFGSTLLLALGLAAASVSAAPTDDVYKLGPDSAPQPGVPQGKVSGWRQLPSQAYPGTLHDYCVYVPAQYDAAKPAALMIFQDGQAWANSEGEYRTPFVLDNLIYRREIPVTIAVFINPGRTPEQEMAILSNWGDRGSNRGQEYNALDDKYAHVITDELMPVLEKQYNLSKNPDERALAGASSGAIAAFTVAWHRPDQFHKVISTIGSFTNIRGGHVYPDLIRSNERKPIRIFLQDGLNDNRGIGRGGPRGGQPPAGGRAAVANTPAPATATPAAPTPAAPSYDATRDWHGQNIKMVAALTEKGYDVNYSFGIGTHSNKQGGAILPDMLRWLWRDYPRADDPIDASNRTLLTPPAAGPGR